MFLVLTKQTLNCSHSLHLMCGVDWMTNSCQLLLTDNGNNDHMYNGWALRKHHGSWRRGIMLLTFMKISMRFGTTSFPATQLWPTYTCLTSDGWFTALCASYQLQGPEEKVHQLRRAGILYVLLQFGLQGEQWQKQSKNKQTVSLAMRRGQQGEFKEVRCLTKRLKASFSFCRLSTNSASEGGLARRVSMPSANNQIRPATMTTRRLHGYNTQPTHTHTGCHFLAKLHSHKMTVSCSTQT